MSYKTIVVPLGAAWRAQKLEVAFQVAHAMDAHLVGLWPVRPIGVPAIVTPGDGPAAECKAYLNVELSRLEQGARGEFEAMAARWAHTKIEWRVSRHELLAATCLSARYADLVIAAQPRPGEEANGHEEGFRNNVVFATGRPVLFVPYAGRFADAGKNVLVAWDASREAARAVTDSLPLLKRAESVRVLVVDPGVEHGEMPGADLALFLARHGVKVTTLQRSSDGIGVGEIILSSAADAGADLIVMGSYGHSRITEFVLGGATRTLLESMTVPVLMAH